MTRTKALCQALEERVSGGVSNETDGKGQGVAAFVAIDLTVVLCHHCRTAVLTSSMS